VQKVAAMQSRHSVPFILKPVLILDRRDIKLPGMQNMQQHSCVRLNKLP